MPELIECETHGECEQTYVCSHLVSDAVGLGFNGAEPTLEKPFPDAWCDECHLIFEAHDGWNDQTEDLVSIKTLCSSCYEKTRIRNLRTDVTLADLDAFRWKCYSCEEWHTGACLDFSLSVPAYWGAEEEQAKQDWPLDADELPQTYLDEDVCIINGEHFFIRGLIHLPIIGTAETFRWGVWGSLSRDNFLMLLSRDDDPNRVELEPMFSWLSSQLADYEDTLSLKMYAHIQPIGERPIFELEPTEHLLSKEYHHGINPERVKEIMKRQLKEIE